MTHDSIVPARPHAAKSVGHERVTGLCPISEANEMPASTHLHAHRSGIGPTEVVATALEGEHDTVVSPVSAGTGEHRRG